MPRLTTKQAAEYTGLAPRYLENLRTSGDGPRFIKLARKVLYDTADLDRWLEARKHGSTADVAARSRRNRAHIVR